MAVDPAWQRRAETTRGQPPVDATAASLDLPIILRDFELIVHNYTKKQTTLSRKDYETFCASQKPILGFQYILGTPALPPPRSGLPFSPDLELTFLEISLAY